MHNFITATIETWKYPIQVIKRLKFNLSLVLIAVFIFIALNTKAQEYSVEYKLYSQTDGLSSNVTNSAVEDKNGIIWIGTQKGITRFDGQYLKAFNKHAFNKIFSLGYFHFKNKCKQL
ncbi:Two component regulator propeller [Spirosomataceae bacterium TFI 002]|nr:Two component regulator propeller [Spirosomataceae bacterium TFI 002]